MTPELQRLLDWVPEGTTFWKVRFKEFDTLENGDKYGMYAEGDEFCPFLSERFLYNLLGKEDARMLRALMREALVSLGLDDMEVRRAL